MATFDLGFCQAMVALHKAQVDVYAYQYSYLVNSDLFFEEDVCIVSLQKKIDQTKKKLMEYQQKVDFQLKENAMK